MCTLAKIFDITIEVTTIIDRINSESALKGSSECICAFETNRFSYTVDTIITNGKAVTRLFDAQFLDEISR